MNMILNVPLHSAQLFCKSREALCTRMFETAYYVLDKSFLWLKTTESALLTMQPLESSQRHKIDNGKGEILDAKWN